MAKLITAKNYNMSYLYNAIDGYSELLTHAIMSSERIDVNSEKFEPVVVDTKRRQTTSVLVDVLRSPNIVLIYPEKSLPSAFNVFAAKDRKTDGKLRVFVDISTTIVERDGFYVPKKIDEFVAQIVAAMIYLIYYADPDRLITNARLVQDSTKAFVTMFCYVLDYLRVSGFSENRKRIMYLTAIYFQTSVLYKNEINDSIRAVAQKVSELDKRQADIAEIFLTDPATQLLDINKFIKFISGAFKLNDLTTELVVDKWLYLFGTGYQFSLEIAPAYFRLVTDTYAGAYINRQKNIEKVIGKEVVSVTKDIFDIGQSVKRR